VEYDICPLDRLIEGLSPEVGLHGAEPGGSACRSQVADLRGHIVRRREAIDTDDLDIIGQEPLTQVRSDKPGCAGDHGSHPATLQRRRDHIGFITAR
jgi:hypothetical protein